MSHRLFQSFTPSLSVGGMFEPETGETIKLLSVQDGWKGLIGGELPWAPKSSGEFGECWARLPARAGLPAPRHPALAQALPGAGVPPGWPSVSSPLLFNSVFGGREGGVEAVPRIYRESLSVAWFQKEVPDPKGFAGCCTLRGIAAFVLWWVRSRGRMELCSNSALEDDLLCFMVKVFQFPFYSEIFIVQFSHFNSDLMAKEMVVLFFFHFLLDWSSMSRIGKLNQSKSSFHGYHPAPPQWLLCLFSSVNCYGLKGHITNCFL